MVKAGKWFRALLGLGKSEHPASPNPNQSTKPAKRRWSFVKSNKDNHRQHPPQPPSLSGNGDVDQTKHAVAVAAATARVAEAAIAAAQAAAAVVQLTSSGRPALVLGAPAGASVDTGSAVNPTACVYRNGTYYGIREVLAAVKIQSHFRAYLSRRALRALKALVRLQALVKGYLVRKHTADYLRSLQAIVRAQSRARAGPTKVSESPQSSTKSVQFHHPGPPTPEKFEQVIRMRSDDASILKRNHSRRRVTGDQEKVRSNRMDYRVDAWPMERQGSSRSGPIDDGKSDKILEIDTGKPTFRPKQRNLFHTSHLSLISDQYTYSLTTSKDSTAHQIVAPHSPSYCEAQSLSPHKFSPDIAESCFCTADNSPQFHSASSKGGGLRVGPFTPSKSDSRSCLSGYSDHPNYMSYTESAKAKVRSLSAPKQRPHYERSSSTKRYSIHGYGELRTNSQRAPALQANFACKAYPGSGRLDSLGMPVIRDQLGFSGGLWHRY